ncbi:sensor domain-containing diguanylate cyclase [Pseudomonas alkylphenolica]|uniref:Sensor domain-containing diguanylate cyclase n=1 Tax=Pseudomonas alkylphenolica TaxID=237609 RepID=A0A443ZSY4_9PSED|nr:sensor domain-containing diguanylate cyclase [Pseudomonas alkylphenolica]RWU22812.1 sensor domain-containing diguanylate cyclase [Pseudomonas alkylphenolica]
MQVIKRRRSFAGFIALAVGLIGFSAALLLKSETHRWETRFSQYVQGISGVVRNQLDTNEAVLAGFTAFLQAVEQSDAQAAARYCEAVLAAYPHLYMIEVARGIPVSEQADFEALLRRNWRADFAFKDFPSLTHQAPAQQLNLGETWPVLFMYPELEQARAIYGVKLESVGYLSYALAQARKSLKPTVSPIFSMYEGENAYILMQSVMRPEQAQQPARPNFFGSTMVALLVIKTDAIRQAVSAVDPDPQVGIRAVLNGVTGDRGVLFAKDTELAGVLDRLLLPRLNDSVEITHNSQPVTLSFERQLRLGDVLTAEALTLLAVLAGALVLMPLVLVRHFKAIEQAEREHEKSAYLATHDVLTKLPNRQLLSERFEQACEHWHQHGVPFALMLIDLDRFKPINDNHGHEVGDQVLRAVASRLLQTARSSDTVARFGGDEFVVLVADLFNAADAEKVGNRMLDAVRQPIVTTAGEFTISCSIGIARCPGDGQNLAVLLKAADHAMYQVKQRGREGVAFAGNEAEA